MRCLTLSLGPHQHHRDRLTVTYGGAENSSIGVRVTLILRSLRSEPAPVLSSLFGVRLGHDVHQRLQHDPMFASDIFQSGGIDRVERGPRVLVGLTFDE